MAICKYCGKSGLLLSINKNSLCKNCDPIVTDLFKKTQYDLRTNQIYLDDPANPEDLHRTINDIRSSLNILIELKNKGILTNDSNPEDLLNTLEIKHDSYYKELFQWEFDQLAIKVANMKVK